MIKKPSGLLLPADWNLEGIGDPNTHLEEYQIKLLSATFARIREVQVINQCTDPIDGTWIKVKRPVSLLVPSGCKSDGAVGAPDPEGHLVDHFLCYRAKALRKLPPGIQVDVADGFQTRRYELDKITKLCIPVEMAEVPGDSPVILSGPDRGAAKPIPAAIVRNPNAHLVCYRAILAKNEIPQLGCEPADPNNEGTPIIPAQPGHIRLRGVHTNNEFGPQQLDTIGERELCIPSEEILP